MLGESGLPDQQVYHGLQVLTNGKGRFSSDTGVSGSQEAVRTYRFFFPRLLAPKPTISQPLLSLLRTMQSAELTARSPVLQSNDIPWVVCLSFQVQRSSSSLSFPEDYGM